MLGDDSSLLAATAVNRAACTRSATVTLVVCGQFLSLLLTGTGVCSQLLSGRNANIPTAQSFANYAALSFFMVPKVWRWWRRKEQGYKSAEKEDAGGINSVVSRTGHIASDHASGAANHLHAPGTANERDEENERLHPPVRNGIVAHLPSTAESTPAHSVAPSHPSSAVPSAVGLPAALSSSSFLSVPLWTYFFLALADVEGNFLLVKAYEYTTITSVQLLDAFTIPIVMILSRLLLKHRYNRRHIAGAAVCVLGLALLITSDIIANRYDSEGSHRVYGDILVLCGCVCYAFSNIGQEWLVKAYDWREFLGMLGVCGSLISAIQMSVLERDALAAIDWRDPVVWSYLLGFNMCLFLLYCFTPLLLRRSSALFLNLSFLTSDFWSVFFAIVLFGARLNALYFVAFVVIVAGLILYNIASVKSRSDADAPKDIWTRVREICFVGQQQIGETDDIDGDEYSERIPSRNDSLALADANSAGPSPNVSEAGDQDSKLHTQQPASFQTLAAADE